MRTVYTLEVTVIQDDEWNGPLTSDSPAGGGIEAALGHRIEQLGVEVQSVRCCSRKVLDDGEDEIPASRDADRESSKYEPGEYLAVWPDGECSIVIAQSTRDAREQLKQRAGSAPESIRLFESFLEL